MSGHVVIKLANERATNPGRSFGPRFFWTAVRAIIHDDDLPLCRSQREPEDAVDGFAQQFRGQVIVCQDKTDQWLLFHIGCKGNKKYGNLCGFNFISKKVR